MPYQTLAVLMALVLDLQVVFGVQPQARVVGGHEKLVGVIGHTGDASNLAPLGALLLGLKLLQVLEGLGAHLGGTGGQGGPMGAGRASEGVVWLAF